MTKRQKLLTAAVAGLTMGLSAPPAALAEEKAADVHCYGINSCGHHSKCSITTEDMAAVRKLLGDKDYEKGFGKSEAHSCGSHAKCGASSQILNWTPAAAGECHAKGGILIEGAEGKKTAKKA